MRNTKILNNAKWIIVCKAAQSLLQMVIGMLCARYLGPANYGLINYAASVMAFFIPLMQLGFNATLVRELIDSPEREGEILGTSLMMQLVSGVVCIFLIWQFAGVANPGERQTQIVCVLYSISLLFQAVESVQYWFHSKLQSKYPSIMMLTAYVVVSAYRIYILISQKSIYWFAVVHSIEYGLIGLSLLVIFRKQAEQRLCFSFLTAKQLFSRSRYYILASMMVTVFQNTDHIMLKMISGDTENGLYTAAITCAGVIQFVYSAVIDSMRPVILNARKLNSEEYELNICRLYGITTYMALIQAAGFAVFARLIVWILFGPEYLSAVPVLRILVWYTAFSYMGAVRNIWILAEGNQRYLWKINLAGAAANILLNALLIPRWGACGAAFASLATQFFANFVLGFMIAPLRKNNQLLLAGLHPMVLWDMWKQWRERQ